MKEPITGRDLFVISTMSAGLGALGAWGLFYSWGSAPSPKTIDWPAWVQAIGSVLAIVVAICIAAHERSILKAEAAKRDHLEMIGRLTRANRAMERFQRIIETQLDFARTQIFGSVTCEIIRQGLPDEIKELERECYLMGDAGGHCLTVTSEFLEAQELIQASTLPARNAERFIQRLEHAQAASNKALKSIREPLWCQRC